MQILSISSIQFRRLPPSLPPCLCLVPALRHVLPLMLFAGICDSVITSDLLGSQQRRSSAQGDALRGAQLKAVQYKCRWKYISGIQFHHVQYSK